MNMKKFLASVLSASLMLGLLAGCGGNTSAPAGSGANPGASTSAPAAGDKVIKIGVFEPASGDSASGGKK